VRVLRPAGAELAQRFGTNVGLTPLSEVPVAIAPRLAELRRLSAPHGSLALAARSDGVIVGLFDGEEALRHLCFSAAGMVARGTAEPLLYVSSVEELPPF
jgi:hypothetical protein